MDINDFKMNDEDVSSQSGNNVVNNNISQSSDANQTIDASQVVDENVDPAVANASINDVNMDDVDFSYFDGKVLEFLGYHFLSGFITAFTLGVFRPWAQCIVKKYKYSHTIYNGKRLKFDGNPEELFVNYFRWIFFTIITFGIYLFWVPVKMKEWEMAHVHFEDEPLVEGDSYFTGTVGGLFGTNLLCVLMTVCTLGLLFPLAYCKRTKWFLNNSVISKNFVSFEGRSFKFFLKLLKWSFLSLITFGIYGFWIELRLNQWLVSNTTLMKDDGMSVS